MPTLYISTTETSTGGEPESDDEWCHHSDTVRSVSFDSVSRNPQGFWGCGTSFEVSQEVYESDKVFLVIVRYSDGGTFGRTTGNWEILGSFLTEQEALTMATSIEDGTMEKNSKYPYALPWVECFNSLEDVEVHCFLFKTQPETRVVA